METQEQRNLQNLCTEQMQEQESTSLSCRLGDGVVSTERYFDALNGPELEVLEESEDAILPAEEIWPFLLRFPISSFGIVLGLGSQTILWKLLASTSSISFFDIPEVINLTLWCIALIALVVITTTYILKCIFYFEAVRREYFHPVRINFFFAPSIAGMFLAIGVPRVVSEENHPAVWCSFMLPLLILELKIYGQWLSGGDRRLSKVANPNTHLSVAGNFVGALLAAEIGWRETALFFWSIGLAHYLVLFVTLYQRLPTNKAIAKELHPAYFLFVAAPSTASIAWEAISGHFDFVSRITYFTALFLLFLLVVRVNFFRGFRFSIAWWAYTFPLAAISIATLNYAEQVTSSITHWLVILLSLVSVITVCFIFLSTLCHAFLWGTLFPNDLAIAISQNKQVVGNESVRI